MNLALLSFFAGVLTVLSPCVLPLLPIVLGGSVGERNWRAPATIIASLGVSIFAFTMLLRVSTAFLDIPQDFWEIFAGAVIVLVGISMLYPQLWLTIAAKLKLQEKSESIRSKGEEKPGIVKNIFLGLSLGPIFASCSPTYSLILATVLPSSWVRGIFYLLLYILGLLLVLAAVAIGGYKVTAKLKWAIEPGSKFRKIVATLLIVVGLLIATGVIREIEIWWAASDFNLVGFEVGLLPE